MFSIDPLFQGSAIPSAHGGHAPRQLMEFETFFLQLDRNFHNIT
jgi:hypothetical protein